MEQVDVHPRIMERHPDIEESEVVYAWNHCFKSMPRIDKNPNEYVAVGADRQGRLLELVAVRTNCGGWFVYHAQTPPQKGIVRELGIDRRKQ